jgi:Tol biopolymer transport system component
MTSIRSSAHLAFLVAFTLLAGCGGTAASVAPVPSVAAAAAPSPRATFAASAPSRTEAPSRIAVLDGEPWLLYVWVLRGKNTRDMFLARPDGSDSHPITQDVPGDHAAPSWSADGSHIVFVVRNPPQAGGSLWTANADGSGAELLFDHGDRCEEAFHPSWSPDGTRLAFVCYIDEQTATIQVLDPVSKSMKELVRATWPEFIDNQPRWSSDGKTIAFDTIKWDPTNEFVVGSLVATVPAGGGKVHRLTQFDFFAAAPDWSPDDTLLAFNTYDIGNMHKIDQPSNVYTIAPDGSKLRQVTSDSTDGTMRIGLPRWSADGSRMWVSVLRDRQTGASSAPLSEIAWIDASSGALTELHFEGKGARPRP